MKVRFFLFKCPSESCFSLLKRELGDKGVSLYERGKKGCL